MDGAVSIIHIPAFDNSTVWGSDIYGRTFLAVEMNSCNPYFGEEIDVTLEYKHGMNSGCYSPSALQEFSDHGFMKLYPKYYCRWKVLNPKYTMTWSHGMRPDHVDVYYNRRILYAGLQWE